ncbi:MAG: hypothetical protein LBN27_02010 [Prevotellaceae bacterium]|nr:hypothetical protein [Prevotellaceae bacterium]
MKERVNFNKSVKIYDACASDNARAYLGCVNFVDGYMIASNAHILVFNKLNEVCNLDLEQLRIGMPEEMKEI